MDDVPVFTTARIAALYRSEWLRSNGGEAFYTGPFYGDSIPRAVREERRRMVTFYVPHTFRDGSQPGLCRVCSFPQADAACATTLED